MTIGIQLTNDTMVLTRGRDFVWHFVNLDADENEIDFPDGDLFFEVFVDPEAPLIWPFVIVDSRASIKIEHTVCDTVPARTKWQLVWLEEGEAAGGEPISIGTVRVQG